MKILITGATGFIGSHLTELCVELGYKTTAFDRYNPNNHWGWLENSEYKHDVEVILGDIRDYDSVYNAMKGCETIFHLAALIGIPYSYISPLAYIRTNIEGTYNVLEAARQLEIEQVLVTSTSETYGTAQYIPIDENHSLIGQSPYSASKIGADQLAISYNRSFNFPVKIVRPFNTYGPRQSARAIIPTIISQILDGANEIKLGNLTPTRDFVYVKDVVNGFIEIAKSDKTIGEEINIATKSEISIKDLAEEIIKQINPTTEIVYDKKRVRPEKSEVERLYGSNEKIKKLTNWEPKYSLSKGLKETIKWFSKKENIIQYKADIYNV